MHKRHEWSHALTGRAIVCRGLGSKGRVQDQADQLASLAEASCNDQEDELRSFRAISLYPGRCGLAWQRCLAEKEQ